MAYSSSSVVARSLLALAAAAATAAASPPTCGTCANGGPPPMLPNHLVMACPGTATISIDFASYGNAAGSCGSFAPGSCSAANSSSVVSAACLGSSSCTVWPNTTTFGDPCFGTVKDLVVQFECSDGSAGSADCISSGPPPPPVFASVSADFSASAASATGIAVTTYPSLQVVSQRLLFKGVDEAVYANAWAGLKHLASLGLKSSRFVPWIPYVKAGVAEREPPSGHLLCGPHDWAFGQPANFTLGCGADGGTVASVEFASWGNPGGVCGAYAAGTCNDPTSLAAVQAACVGQASCTLGPYLFPSSPCAPSSKPYLAVQATCSNASKQFTYWDFTYVDSLFLDFMGSFSSATSADARPIPNFSTQPTWLYSPSSFSYPQDPALPWYGYDKGTAPAANLTALGDYYGRLLSWYTRGGFTDEYGNTQASGHFLNISLYEIFNEVDYEHGHTVESYTLEYDAVVSGIRRWTGAANSDVQFVGLSLPNIDDSDKVDQWVNYFLNASNHDPAVVDAVQSGMIGFHAYPTNGGYGPDPTTFAGMFAYLDTFVAEVGRIANATALLAPAVKIALDESGVDMDGVLDGALAPPLDNPRFWVAGAGYFVELWSRASSLLGGGRVHVVAQSQYMDAPGQEPSVSMLDWTTGLGTAKYWALELLLRTTSLGDTFLPTSTNASVALHAQAFLHATTAATTAAPPSASDQHHQRAAAAAAATASLLLVSRANAFTQVQATLSGVDPAAQQQCTALCVDETTALGPAAAVPCTAAPGGAAGEVVVGVSMMPYATCVVTMGA